MTESTHLPTTPNKRVPTPMEKFRDSIPAEFVRTVTSYYRGREEEALMFQTAMVDYVRKVPKLLETNPTSLLSAFVQAAQFRFMPSGVMGECYVIPYGNEAKFQIGYQGIVTLLYRAGVKGISANVVYENDEFNYEEGLNPILYHKPVQFGEKRGKAIGVYTVAQLEGGARTFKVMDKDAVMGIKDLSKAKGSKESPWNSDKDPELWMWKKTCLIQHAKTLPKTQEIQKAIELDYEGEGSDRGRMDAGGPGVGKAFHAPEANDHQDDKPEPDIT